MLTEQHLSVPKNPSVGKLTGPCKFVKVSRLTPILEPHPTQKKVRGGGTLGPLDVYSFTIPDPSETLVVTWLDHDYGQYNMP
jgi:hypothetical protein